MNDALVFRKLYRHSNQCFTCLALLTSHGCGYLIVFLGDEALFKCGGPPLTWKDCMLINQFVPL